MRQMKQVFTSIAGLIAILIVMTSSVMAQQKQDIQHFQMGKNIWSDMEKAGKNPWYAFTATLDEEGKIPIKNFTSLKAGQGYFVNFSKPVQVALTGKKVPAKASTPTTTAPAKVVTVADPKTAKDLVAEKEKTAQLTQQLAVAQAKAEEDKKAATAQATQITELQAQLAQAEKPASNQQAEETAKKLGEANQQLVDKEAQINKLTGELQTANQQISDLQAQIAKANEQKNNGQTTGTTGMATTKVIMISLVALIIGAFLGGLIFSLTGSKSSKTKTTKTTNVNSTLNPVVTTTNRKNTAAPTFMWLKRLPQTIGNSIKHYHERYVQLRLDIDGWLLDRHSK